MEEVDRARTDAAVARPGGRTARTAQAVIDATLAELSETGYTALRIDAVAERAGVNKSTIYRRWGDKAGLVSDALIERRSDLAPPPDTGSLRGDVLELLKGIRLGLRTPWIAALVREAGPRTDRNAELYRLLDAFWPARYKASREMFARSVERGELPAGTDLDLLIEVISGPLYFRWLMLGEELDDAHLERLAEFVLTGARATAP
ncbi:TetR/AcrR family transcriptional regulator [Actinomadura sp. WMMB 499]|uniref:TetR/AcrR family transcriptional regulator n=1 Tax=Actinomadura sp. WMMB 499 TaxID=1219491 RepID=UPI0012486A12|nr:TetR/AcrR family transcriptional regulator [Actinomadura sp. WMMB 499]QFG24559.1 TetR/AcrR family transcriptional regulator [Actinomadura sp. WMMB 499]